jgi:predicted transcriptional regulator
LKIDKERKRILELKARSRQVADKGKHTEEYIMETSLKEYREKKLMFLSVFFQ